MKRIACLLLTLATLAGAVAPPPPSPPPPHPPSPPPSPPAYVTATCTLAGYTPLTFAQTQVDGFLTEIATRLDVSPAAATVVGFSPSGAAALSLTVQATTTQAQSATVAATLNAFLTSGATALAALKARGLSSLTAVTLAAAASTSTTTMPALFSVTTSNEIKVNASAYYAMVGVGASLVVVFLACSIVVCSSSWRQRLGHRPEGPPARVGARGGGRWKTGAC